MTRLQSPPATVNDSHGWLSGLRPSKVEQPQLPERVRNTIRDQQDASEILIGWVQLGVVSVFGGLYLLAPKPFTLEAEFAPVPWVLGGYLAFLHPHAAGCFTAPPNASMDALCIGSR